MDEQAYRSADAVSHSLLKEFARSPAHFHHRLANPVKETEAMLLGTLIHTMVLEPEEVKSRFIRAEDCDRRTKVGKAKWAELNAEAEEKGLRLIQAGQYDHASRIADALDKDVTSSIYIDEARQGTIEKPLFWTREGVEVKGRPDSILEDGTILDVKTTQSCAPWHFQGEIFRRSYHTQGAFSRSGFLANGGSRWRAHVLVCVETEAPYTVGVFRLGEEVITNADKTISRWLERYRTCVERNEWPGYGQHSVTTPTWALAEVE